jgi:hypothetical protein
MKLLSMRSSVDCHTLLIRTLKGGLTPACAQTQLPAEASPSLKPVLTVLPIHQAKQQAGCTDKLVHRALETTPGCTHGSQTVQLLSIRGEIIPYLCCFLISQQKPTLRMTTILKTF